ncbi:DUF305 domain-containing protein [Ornithinimicrobium sp. Arc0846-15]|nr:DUF305 domain-containing protein [Ornithinimicrobium laminariae]
MTFALSACTTEEPSSTEPTTSEQQEPAEEFNDADVEFTTGMIPHHQQAIVMSEMAVDQGGPEVADLAERIEAAQDPEIDTMRAWLQDWGVDVPTGMGDMGDMGDMGMMSPGEMQDMMEAEGDQFDTIWLEMMIEHHEGAISMSRAQQDEGLNPDAVALAGTIIEAQQSEIDEMEQMLGSGQ